MPDLNRMSPPLLRAESHRAQHPTPIPLRQDGTREVPRLKRRGFNDAPQTVLTADPALDITSAVPADRTNTTSTPIANQPAADDDSPAGDRRVLIGQRSPAHPRVVCGVGIHGRATMTDRLGTQFVVPGLVAVYLAQTVFGAMF